MTPRQLLRLYPRQWRRRYGDEFLAILEDTPIDGRVMRDVVRAAAGEWIFDTYTGRTVIALVLSAVGSVIAQELRDSIVALPLIEPLADGHKLVSPPWPTSLGVWASGLQLVFMARSFFPRARMTRLELMSWIGLFFVGSIGSQWGALVAWDGTGIRPDSALSVFGFHYVMTHTALTFNWGIATTFNPRADPTKPSPSIRPPARPLGLTR